MGDKMGTFGEIECAFICRNFSDHIFASVCGWIVDNSFCLDVSSPGFVCGGEFDFPEWTSLDEALQQIQNASYDSYCINFKAGQNFSELGVLIVGAEVNDKCITLKVGEEFFLCGEKRHIDREKFLKFVSLAEGVGGVLDVLVWKISQSGFSYALVDGFGFIEYALGKYPISEIDRLVEWYNQNYLTRW